MSINQIIDLCVVTFLQHGSKSREYRSVYDKHRTKLEAHKQRVLEAFYYKERVTITGVLQRRGDGKQGNLNLVSPAFVNGNKVEHLNVYDEVIDGALIDYDNGTFIASNCVVYKYLRRGVRDHKKAAYGVKPEGAPRMHNEV